MPGEGEVERQSVNEDRAELLRLSIEMNKNNLSMQQLGYDVRSALKDQERLQGDFVEMRLLLAAVRRLLQDGDGGVQPLMVRMVLAEKRLDVIEVRTAAMRGWWLRILGALVPTLIVGLTLAFLALYKAGKT